jgi:vitamin B12 transporter
MTRARHPVISPSAITLTLGLLLGAVPCGASAQVQRDTVTLKELVVTADRDPTPLARTVAATTVITGDELRQRGGYFLSEALRQVPGAAVVSQGSDGGVTSLFLRGGESDYTKVLIDGVPVNQAGGSFNFGLLSTDNIERIEIVRGPVSVLYGSDAVTGVIQVFTRKGAGALRTELTGQAGSHGSYAGSASIRGGTAELSYSASLSRYATDGVYDFNSLFGNTVGSAALTARPDDRTAITLTARTGDNTLRFPTDFTGAVTDSNQLTRQNSQTLGLDLARRFSERAEVRLQLASHNQVDGAENNPDSPGDADFFFQSQGRSQRRSADARGLVQLSSMARVTVGGQVEVEDLREFSTTNDPFAATRNNLGLYGQSVFTPGRSTVLNVGLRLEDNEEFGTHLTYRVGAVQGVSGGLRLRASIGSSFKEPSLRENFAQDAFEVGNPELDPEQSRSWEVGLEQELADGRMTVAANYFDQRFTDLIQYLSTGVPDEPTYQNVSQATSRGVELIADLRPASWLAVTASYTYLETRVADAGTAGGTGSPFEEGKPLVRRPKHSARIDARSRIADRASIGVSANYVGQRADIDFTLFPSVRRTLPSYVALDADASFDIRHGAGGRPGITATVRAENLFNKAYDTVLGYRGRGRAVFGGFRLGF